MSDDLSLFGGDEPPASAPPAPEPAPIADWQVDLLRKALDARGWTDMGARQQVVEAAAGRAVDSLRALTHDEAMTVLTRLGQVSASTARSGSRWADREDDTWIDRL